MMRRCLVRIFSNAVEHRFRFGKSATSLNLNSNSLRQLVTPATFLPVHRGAAALEWAHMTLTSAMPSLIYSDPGGEHLIQLEPDSTFIGRSLDQDLVLTESYVSRRHASIHMIDGHFELVDEKSSHGTYLNGQRIDRAHLSSGDTLQFGSPTAPVYRVQNQTAKNDA